jgi:hypothetical protein
MSSTAVVWLSGSPGGLVGVWNGCGLAGGVGDVSSVGWGAVVLAHCWVLRDQVCFAWMGGVWAGVFLVFVNWIVDASIP